MEFIDVEKLLSSIINEPSQLTGIIISLLFGAALVWFLKEDNNDNVNKHTKKNDSTSKQKTPTITKRATSTEELGASGSEPDASIQSSEDDGNQQLRNVFSVKQKPIATGDGANGKHAASDRPFESSYYFAHNKHSTGGGYKDGLRAEDYVMNGPRLLSKGGISTVDEPKNETPSDNRYGKEAPNSQKNSTEERTKSKLTASTPITKYMWDDDGSGNVAKIHLDSLPISSTETTKWEKFGITSDQVGVRLIGENNEGLYVGIAQGEKRYHLHVSKMYGEAVSAKCIVKKHKLLVKITKKKVSKRHSNRHTTTGDGGVWKAATKALGKLAGGVDGEAKEEFMSVAWPRLSASSAGGLGGGKTVIDEKLFKTPTQVKGNGDDILDFCS